MEDRNHIDELFRQQLSNASLTPPPGVWESVASSVASGSSATGTGAGLSLLGKWIAVMVTATVISVGSYYFLTRKNKSQKQAIVRTEHAAQETVKTENEIRGETNPSVTPAAPGADIAAGNADNNSDKPLKNDQGNQHGAGNMQLEVPVPIDPVKPFSNDHIITSEPIAPLKPTESSSTSFVCPKSLSIKSVKTSMTGYEFTAEKPIGPVTWYMPDGSLLTGYQIKCQFSEVPGVYIVKAYSVSMLPACSDSSFVEIRIVGQKPELVNFFSPNGDGLNDYYYVDINHPKVFELEIFDASNRLVFRSKNPDEKWDGTYNGINCPDGRYQVVLTWQFDGEEKASVQRDVILLNRTLKK